MFENTFHNTKKIFSSFIFLNISENNFYMVIKRGSNRKRHYNIFTCMQHDMPQSLLVFVVSFTPETPNFGTFGGVAHPP